MNLSALERRLCKLEKSQSAGTTAYLMENGTQVVLNDCQRRKGFEDCVYGIESSEARVMLTAVRSNDGSCLLELIQAIVNPLDTKPEPNEAINVGSEPVAHSKTDENHSIQNRLRQTESALAIAEYELMQARQNQPKRCELKQAAYQRAKQEQESAAREWNEYIKAGKQRNQ